MLFKKRRLGNNSIQKSLVEGFLLTENLLGGKMAFKYRLHGFVRRLWKEGHSRYLFYRFSIKNSSNVFIFWTDPKLKIYQKSIEFLCKEEDIVKGTLYREDS